MKSIIPDDNIIIIMCKKVTKNLYDKYSLIGLKDIIFISDKIPDINSKNIIYYDDNVCIENGFWGMHSSIKITSWDKAFYYLKMNMLTDKYYWLIEDDCYINKLKFNQYVNNLSKYKHDVIFFGWYKTFPANKWHHWSKNNNIFSNENLHATINQILRLSPNFINKILEFQANHNRFIFHEMLIPSIGSKFKLNGLLIKDKKINISAKIEKSLINKKFNKSNKNQIIRSLNSDYIVVHPFKLWYDI